MPRTTAELVEGIIEVDSDIDLTPFITVANALVEEIASPSKLSDTRLELVERWLSAHFYTVRDPRTTSENAGGVGATYQSAVALGLSTSHYGQQAMILDTSGLLRRLSKGKKAATGFWAGKTDDERLLDT